MLRMLLVMVLVGCFGNGFPQDRIENYVPYDPSNTLSRVPVEFDSYYFLAGHRIYSALFSYRYGLANNRHLMGISIPVIHAIFNDDFAGFENTTGIGDIRFHYLGVPYLATTSNRSLRKIAAYLDVSTPTGNQRLGRGVGSWVYQPGIIFTYQPDLAWFLFPEINFQFTTVNVNSYPGNQGLPDLEDLDADGKLNSLTLRIPTTYEITEWDAWIGLSGDYTYSFTEQDYYLFLRTEVGKMIGDKTAGSLQLVRNVAGTPRLQTVFQAKLIFFLR